MEFHMNSLEYEESSGDPKLGLPYPDYIDEVLDLNNHKSLRDPDPFHRGAG